MRLLIVRLSAMGDVIHTLPLAENARAEGVTVGWVVERAFSGLLEGNPHCARVIVADTRGWRRRPFSSSTWRGLAELRADVRAFAPDLTLDAQGLWKSAVVARSAGAPVVGFAASARREPSSALLCQILVTPGPDARHVVDRNLALLSAAGVAVTARAPDAAYLLARPNPEADAFVAALPRPFAVFHPGAGRPEKAWGEERMAALAAALRERRGLAPVVSWGPGDEDRAERLTALVPGARRAPRLDFPGLARLYAVARLFVGGDTGPLHLADALGAPTLALFGPTDPRRNGPYRDRRGIVEDMRAASDEQVLRLAESL
jgi:lipopolysaccharide heptosyltransferase I